jgi:hypothetical protein
VKRDAQTFVGIQLHPFALKFLFGIPSTEFTDRVVNGFDVCDSLRVLHEELSLADHLKTGCPSSSVAGAKDQDPQHPAGPERDLRPSPVADLEHQSVKSLSAYYNVSERHLAGSATSSWA